MTEKPFIFMVKDGIKRARPEGATNADGPLNIANLDRRSDNA